MDTVGESMKFQIVRFKNGFDPQQTVLLVTENHFINSLSYGLYVEHADWLVQ